MKEKVTTVSSVKRCMDGIPYIWQEYCTMNFRLYFVVCIIICVQNMPHYLFTQGSRRFDLQDRREPRRGPKRTVTFHDREPDKKILRTVGASLTSRSPELQSPLSPLFTVMCVSRVAIVHVAALHCVCVCIYVAAGSWCR